MALQCLERQGICLIRGQALEIRIPVEDEGGGAVDLSSADIVFGVAKSKSTSYDIVKNTGGSDITIEGDNNETIVVTLSGDDTDGLNVGNLFYSCWVVMSDVPTPVARGALTVQDDPRANG